MTESSRWCLALDRFVVERPDAIVIVDDERAWTWRELDALGRAHAARLGEAGVGPGDRVAVMAPTSAALVAVALAHLRLGVVHVPVNTRYREDEARYVIEHAGARVLVDDPRTERTPLPTWPAPPSDDALAMLV